jgi:polyphosphate glucokinase
MPRMNSPRPDIRKPPTVLLIEVRAGSTKLMLPGRRALPSFDTEDAPDPRDVAAHVKKHGAQWEFDVVSIAFPGPLREGRPVADPPGVGKGWVSFDYEKAFRHPVRMIDPVSMQALAAYRGPRMLFVDLGAGLKSALIADDILTPLELGWLRFDAQHNLVEQLTDEGPRRVDYRRWPRDVVGLVADLKAAFGVKEVVLGGQNAARAKPLPRGCRIQTGVHTMVGATRLWGDADGVIAIPRGSCWEIHGMRRSD